MSDRRKEIVSAAKKIVQETLRVTDDYFISHGQDEISWFRAGAEWDDSHPEPHALDNHAPCREQLTQAQALLERAKGIIESIQFMRIPPLRQEAEEWLKEFETVMKREGMQK